MRPSHHADESILRVHVRQVRDLKLASRDQAATCAVKGLLELSPNCCLATKTTGPTLTRAQIFLRYPGALAANRRTIHSGLPVIRSQSVASALTGTRVLTLPTAEHRVATDRESC
jgi:hypothetical protein